MCVGELYGLVMILCGFTYTSYTVHNIHSFMTHCPCTVLMGATLSV